MSRPPHSPSLNSHPQRIVDLRSDTVTRPSAAMRQAIVEAEVGDHLLGDDPTAAELERLVAALLGKERALYFPSGTMANQTAIRLHTRPGTEVLVMRDAHVLLYEEGAAAAWSGVQMREVGTNPGELDVDGFEAFLQPPSRYLTEVSLVCLENTHNSGGGSVLPLESVRRVSARAREVGLPVHLDGARLPNAAVASGIPMGDWAAEADTVMVSLSKGLGAPVGSMLAGSNELMERAWRIRRRFGGAMRQAGLLAAAGIHALRNNLDRLADDHRRARALASGVDPIPGLRAGTPQTNIVLLEADPSLGSISALVERVQRAGVLLTPFGGRRIRAVTHLDVDDEGIERAIEALRASVA